MSRFTRKWQKRWQRRKPYLYGLFFAVVGLGIVWAWNQFFIIHSTFTPKPGGIYTEATIGSVKYLNPLDPGATSVDRDIHKLLHAGLLEYNPVTQQVEDGLATLSVHDRGREYQLKLKPNLYFSNGKPIDIADVLFTYEEIIKNPSFGNKDLVEVFQYIDISVINEDTIAFKLPEKNVFLATFLTQPILSKESFSGALIQEVLDPDYPANKRPVGAGPLRLRTIIPEDGGFTRVFFERNPYYYKQTPFIEQFVLYVYPETEVLKFQHQWPNTFSRVSFTEVDTFQGTLYDQYERYDFVLPRFSGVFFNLDRSIPGNLYIRQALRKSSNPEALLEDSWEIVENALLYNGVETKDSTPNYREARQLLENAGFEFDRERDVRTTDGETPLRLSLITTLQPSIYGQFAQNLKNVWEKELSIEIDLQLLDTESFSAKLIERDYDMVLFGQDFTDNFDVLSSWHSSQHNNLNLSNLTRNDIDFFISEIRFTGARSDYQALQDRLDELSPAIVLGAPKESLLVWKSLNNFKPTYGTIRQLADRFWGIETWYFETQKTWNIPNTESRVWSFVRWLMQGGGRLNFAPTPEVDTLKIISDETSKLQTTEPSTPKPASPNTEGSNMEDSG